MPSTKSLLPLALALTTALAAPSLTARQFGPPPPRSDEFTVEFTVPDGFEAGTQVTQSLVATMDGQAPQLLLVGNATSAGTPAFLNGTSPNAALVFDLTSEFGDGPFVYGAMVDDVGSNPGTTSSVDAIQQLQDPHWGVDGDGELFHSLFSPTERFYACRDTVNGAEQWVLTFGVPLDQGVPPPNCVNTTLTINF